MPIILSPELEMVQNWCDMKKYAENLLEEWGYEKYTVKIREATDEEEGVIVTKDACQNVRFDNDNKTMEIIVGKGDNLLAIDNIDDPEDFAQYSVVDMLDQYVLANYE